MNLALKTPILFSITRRHCNSAVLVQAAGSRGPKTFRPTWGDNIRREKNHYKFLFKMWLFRWISLYFRLTRPHYRLYNWFAMTFFWPQNCNVSYEKASRQNPIERLHRTVTTLLERKQVCWPMLNRLHCASFLRLLYGAIQNALNRPVDMFHFSPKCFLPTYVSKIWAVTYTL